MDADATERGGTAAERAERAAARLLAELEAATTAAAAVAGRPPLGARAVESAPGRRAYLCAFAGPAFLCLRADLRPERRAERVREAASASLLWEHLEALVDAERLHGLAAAIGRLLALGSAPAPVSEALQAVAQEAIALARWSDAPERALASLPAVDAAVARQDALFAAYGRYAVVSEPLVEAQETLPDDLVEALRALEQAAAGAGAAERLADRLAGLMPDCDEGAAQMIAAHLTRLE